MRKTEQTNTNWHFLSLMLIAFFLRLIEQARTPWYDELFTYRLAQLPWSAMIAATAGDVHPPGGYALSWLFYQTDLMYQQLPSVASVRFPSLLFSLLSVWLLHRLLLHWEANPFIYWGAMGVMAVAPWQIYYSAEARPYAMLTAAVLWATLSAVKQRPVQLALAGLLGMYAHNMMAIYVPFIAVLWFSTRPAPLKSILVITISILGYLPWLPSLWGQMSAVHADYWIMPITAGRVAVAVNNLFLFWIPTEQVWFAPVLVFIALGVGTWHYRHQWRWQMMAWGPIVVAVLVSIVFRPIFIPRIISGVAPFLYVLAVGGVYALITTHLNSTQSRVLLVLAVIPLIAINAVPVPMEPYHRYYAELPAQPGDVCFHIEPGTAVMANYYVPQCHHVVLAGDHGADSLSPATLSAIFDTTDTVPDSRGGRVFVLYSDSPTAPAWERNALAKALGTRPATKIHGSGVELGKREFWILGESE